MLICRIPCYTAGNSIYSLYETEFFEYGFIFAQQNNTGLPPMRGFSIAYMRDKIRSVDQLKDPARAYGIDTFSMVLSMTTMAKPRDMNTSAYHRFSYFAKRDRLMDSHS